MNKCAVFCVLLAMFAFACNEQPVAVSRATVGAEPAMQASAPAPAVTGGFDGGQAFDHVRRLVELGPRPPGSEAIHKAQEYIATQLKSYGCQVEEHDFHGSPALGDLAMRNIIAKISGNGTGIVLYATHYDTV